MNTIKKLLVRSIAFIIIVASMAVPVFAEDSISVILNGSEVIFTDVRPMMYEDRTLIPVRAIFEDMDCYVDWDEINQMAVIGSAEKIVFIPINDYSIQVYDIATDNQSDIELDVPAMVINNRTMVPLRAICEALGADVEWESNTQTVYIDKK